MKSELDVFVDPKSVGSWCYSNEYVMWLEKKVKLLESGVTPKQIEAEMFVIEYTNDNKKPPTYRIVADKFNIKVSAAYARLKHSRELMKKR